MNLKSPAADVGVIVGRFQTPALTTAHCDLIQSIAARHKKFVIVLGISPVLCSLNNPLDFTSRKAMILERYPSTTILSIADVNSDEVWSRTLDQRLREIHPTESILLYGGRDSFIKHYSGQFTTVEMENERPEISGTQAREDAAHDVRCSEDFRRGVIYATRNQYRKSIVTVDVAITRVVDPKGQSMEVLLGRKATEKKFRFIGGFAEPTSESYEADARREVQEETGCAIDVLTHIGSYLIDDWRFRNERDKIKTIFYEGSYAHGPVRAADDIAEVRWFDVTKLSHEHVIDTHHCLLDAFLEHIGEINVSTRSRIDGLVESEQAV